MKVVYRNSAYKANYKRRVSEGLPIGKPTLPALSVEGTELAEILEQNEDPAEEEANMCDDSLHGEDLEAMSTGTASEVLEGVELDDDDHTLTINGIVLEYLEFLGLEETFDKFKNECAAKAIPLPSVIRNRVLTDKSADVHSFFVAFDEWDTSGIVEKWSKFSEEGDNAKLRQASILLRIYIASLPFRRNEGVGAKYGALEELRNFHQTYSEEFTKDPMCLPLFAFPFVENPDEHPVFKEVFTDQWQINLRQQLQVLLSTRLSTLPSSSAAATCDLKDMYHYFLEIPGDDSKKIVDSKTTANVPEATGSHGDNLRPDVCSYVKRSLRHTQERYCKLLNATTAVVSALEFAVQGKAQDVAVLETKLQNSFPELFGSKEQTQIVTLKSEMQLQSATMQEAEGPALAAGESVAEPYSEDEWTEDEFSDVDTDAAALSVDSEGSAASKGSKLCSASAIVSKTSSGRLNLSGRSSLTNYRRLTARKSEALIGVLERADSVVTLKLTDSKANTRILENAQELAEHEDQEVPEDFCQYFTGISARKPAQAQTMHVEPVSTPDPNLMPPALSSRFPTPPRTYTVSASPNLNSMYIPSSLEVGCIDSLGNIMEVESPRSRSRSMSRGSLRSVVTDEDEEPIQSRSPSPDEITEPEPLPTEEPTLKQRKKWEGDLPMGALPISRHLLPQHLTQEAQLLGSRVLTPPPEKKTAMASLMGVSASTPSPPSKSQIASLKRLQNVVTSSPPRAAAAPAVGTGSQYQTRAPPKGQVKKKFPTESQGYGRVYKLNRKGNESVKPNSNIKVFGGQ